MTLTDPTTGMVAFLRSELKAVGVKALVRRFRRSVRVVVLDGNTTAATSILGVFGWVDAGGIECRKASHLWSTFQGRASAFVFSTTDTTTN